MFIVDTSLFGSREAFLRGEHNFERRDLICLQATKASNDISRGESRFTINGDNIGASDGIACGFSGGEHF